MPSKSIGSNATLLMLQKRFSPDNLKTFPASIGRAAAGRVPNAQPTNGANWIVSTITYVFVTTLGTPGANTVHIKIQPTVKGTFQKFADAGLGKIDVANITYGAGVGGNATLYFYNPTIKKYSINANRLTSGGYIIVFEEYLLFQTTAITFTTTIAGATLIPIERIFYYQYRCELNPSLIPSDWQMLYPYGFSPIEVSLLEVILEKVSSTSTIKRVTVAWSVNENEYNDIMTDVDINKSTNTSGYDKSTVDTKPIPVGAGFYFRFSSDGTSPTEDIDVAFKVYF